MERVGRNVLQFVTKEPSILVNIAAAVLDGRKRTFSKDCKHLSKKFELPVILGQENIPQDHNPVIIACNHPGVYELVVGVVQITHIFSRSREEHRLPGDISWMAAKNLLSRVPRQVFQSEILYPVVNRVLKSIHNSYDFIPVPINYLDPEKLRRERAIALIAARKYLREAHHRTVGVFPEGNFGRDGKLLEFYGGIGMLCKSAGREVTVLPTGIYRDEKGKLTIEFSEPLKVSPTDSARNSTRRIREAVGNVCKSD